MTHKFDANLLKYYDYVVDANSFIFLFDRLSAGNYKYKDNIKTIFINNGTYLLSDLLTYYSDVTEEDSVTIDINNVTEIYVEDDVLITIDGTTTSFFNQTIFPIGENAKLKKLQDFYDIPSTDEFFKILRVNSEGNGFSLNDFYEGLSLNVVTTLENPEDPDTSGTESPSSLASKNYVDANIFNKQDITINSITNNTWNDTITNGFYTDISRSSNDVNSPYSGKDFYGIVFVNGTNILQVVYDSLNNEYVRNRIDGTWTEWKNSIKDKYKELEDYQDIFNKPLYNLLFDNASIIEFTSHVAPTNFYNSFYIEELELFIGTNSTNLYYSNDAITWTLITTTQTGWIDVLYSKELEIIIALSSNGYIYYSYNGIEWFDSNYTYGYAIEHGAYSSDLEIFIGCAFEESKIVYSYNGIDWYETEAFSSDIYNATWGNNKFVGVGEGTNEIAYSYDGIHWFFGDLSEVAINSILYDSNNKKFMAFNATGVFISSDGISWNTKITLPTFSNYTYTSYNEKLGLFISSNAISKDGTNWVKINHEDINTIYTHSYSIKLKRLVLIGIDGSSTRYIYTYDINFDKLFED